MNTPKKIMAHPLVDDNSGMSCHSSALSYLESTLHSSDNDIFIVDRRTTIHWRKRSGIGLCAVAYVLSPGAGRGETVYLSNFNRMVSGKGHTKFRAKLIEAMKTSYLFESGATEVSKDPPINLPRCGGKSKLPRYSLLSTENGPIYHVLRALSPDSPC